MTGVNENWIDDRRQEEMARPSDALTLCGANNLR
jgi:hypothetical protein